MPLRSRPALSRRTRARGRARSSLADQAIREAALDLLAELGYSALSMDSLARQARVSKATIYRRWPSKEEAIASLLEELVREVSVPDTGKTREDFRATAENIARYYRRTPAGRAIVALVSEMASHPRIATVVRSGLMGGWRRALRSVLERGKERGDVRPDADPEVALDLLMGPIVYRILFSGGALNRAYARAVADEVYRALAVAPAAGEGAR